MLHLSFTQQLCHSSKIKPGEAANDAIYGGFENADVFDQSGENGSLTASRPTPYVALKQIAERYLKSRR